jgi:hypothetical protein
VLLRALVALAVSMVLAGCGSSSPTGPSPAALTLQAIFLVAPDWTVPAGGGSLEITVLTTGTLPNSTVPNVPVTVSATQGTLSTTHLTTGADGRARVTWSGDGPATIRATAGTIDVSYGVTIATPPAAPPLPPTGAPAPGPVPPPNLPPAPPAAYTAFIIVSGTYVPQTDAYAVGSSIGFGVSVNGNGGPMPAAFTFAWDFDGDGAVDAVTSAPRSSATTYTYATAGTYHPSVVATADGITVTSAPTTIKVQ